MPSGDLEQALVDDGLVATTLYPAVERPVGAAGLRVDIVRGLGLTVEHDPVETNWYHGAISGIRKDRHKRDLKNAATEIIPVDQVVAARWYAERESGGAAT